MMKQWDTPPPILRRLAHRDTMLPLIHEGHALADRGTRMGILTANGGTLSPATDMFHKRYTAGVTDMFRAARLAMAAETTTKLARWKRTNSRWICRHW